MRLIRLPSGCLALFQLCCTTRITLAAPRYAVTIAARNVTTSAPPGVTNTPPDKIDTKISSLELKYSSILSEIHVEEVESLLLSPPPWNTQTSTTISRASFGYQYPFSFSFITGDPALETTSELLRYSAITETVTVIQEELITVTISEAPMTETKTIFISVPLLACSSTFIIPSIPSPPPPPPPPVQPSTSSPAVPSTDPSKTTWSAPADMTDLSSFQVIKFGGGKDNLKIVSSIPSDAQSKISTNSKTDPDSDLGQGSTAMQLFYPANSIDPAQKPQGGAEFYASPIDISDAQNVTLTYSVFFPKNFNWVLAGKLPGLYGGHPGCSGGNAALDCFSTRLMWRKAGAGELYLYAPKEKQTEALCADPQSVCDAAYGLSIGRGSFHWTPGTWTTVHQTVFLNTPGEQDGEFTLEVDGKRAIYRNDVLYREDLAAAKSKSAKKTGKSTRSSKSKTTRTKKPVDATTTTPAETSSTDDGDILGPLLSGILGGLRRRNEFDSHDPVASITSAVQPTLSDLASIQPKPTIISPTPTMTSLSSVLSTDSDDDNDDDPLEIDSAKETEVKFAGIFFSTFFGGHEPQYATPEDQYVWFKDFALTVNS